MARCRSFSSALRSGEDISLVCRDLPVPLENVRQDKRPDKLLWRSDILISPIVIFFPLLVVGWGWDRQHEDVGTRRPGTLLSLYEHIPQLTSMPLQLAQRAFERSLGPALTETMQDAAPSWEAKA